MRISSIACLPLLVALSACAPDDEPRMKAYELDLTTTSGSPADMRFLLDAPAGKDGFLTVADGHIVKPDGTRFRIWGVNLAFSGNLPAKENAPRYADLLARFGVNSVRVHHCDRPWPRGLIDDSRGDTRQLNHEALDRFDFFLNELKQRGIYVDLNLNVSRPFVEGDGVKDAELIGYGKALTYFDPVLIELQEEYARHLLTHLNPYTGNQLLNEPAIAIIELVNENSIVESWVRGRLLGHQITPNRATWTDIPPSYAKDLDRLYNDWLRQHHGLGPDSQIARLKPSEFPGAKQERFQTEAAFYMHLEASFFERMRHYIKDELGARQLLVGTSAHSRSLSPYPLLTSTSLLDIVDGHTYWQHPNYQRDPKTGERLSWSIPNTAMVNDPLHSSIQALARNAVAGRPYTVSEVNHPWPAEHAAEGIPILAAYAALQDWDGIYLYSFAHIPPAEWEGSGLDFFDIRNDPVKMSQVAAGALLFLRGDVAAAKETVARDYTREQVIETLRMPSSEGPFFDPAFSPALPLIHTIRIGSFNGIPGEHTAPAESPIRSDTGQLAWYYEPEGNGLVTVDTPRSQALIGFVKANALATTHLAAEVANDFCTLTLHSLDGKPIAQSEKLLLTTGAKVGATGMKWSEDHTSLTDMGGPPATIETVVGRIGILGLEGARGVNLQPLDGAGQPTRSESVTCIAGECAFQIGAGEATPWYMITVNR